jgi:hypothetical protein
VSGYGYCGRLCNLSVTLPIPSGTAFYGTAFGLSAGLCLFYLSVQLSAWLPGRSVVQRCNRFWMAPIFAAPSFLPLSRLCSTRAYCLSIFGTVVVRLNLQILPFCLYQPLLSRGFCFLPQAFGIDRRTYFYVKRWLGYEYLFPKADLPVLLHRDIPFVSARHGEVLHVLPIRLTRFFNLKGKFVCWHCSFHRTYAKPYE